MGPAVGGGWVGWTAAERVVYFGIRAKETEAPKKTPHKWELFEGAGQQSEAQ